MPKGETGAAPATKQTSNARNKKTKKTDFATSSNAEELLDTHSEEARKLCALAHHIYQEAPWEFMEETDIFGFEDPETGELGFISVMGALGEYKAIAVYRGVEALNAWIIFQDLLHARPGSDEARDTFLEIPQLQLSFEPTSFLETRDREMLKHSGLKFGKEKPQFRSRRPGYLPWFLTTAEARHLIYALEQTSAVAKQFSDDHEIIQINHEPEDNEYLIRVPQVDGSKVTWENHVKEIPLRNSIVIPYGVEDVTIEQLKQLPKSGAHEVDLFTLPARIGEEGERPRVLYALLLTDSESEFVLGFEALQAVDGIDLLYAGIAEKVVAMWLRHEIIPAELRARTIRLLDMFQHVAGELGVSLALRDKLPAVNKAKRSVIEWLRKGQFG